MKRLIQVLSLLILSVFLFACRSEESQSESNQAEPLRLGLLIQEKGDHSFNDVAADGMDQAKLKFGDDVYLRIFEFGENPEAAFFQATSSDFDVLVGPSELQDLVSDFADEFPDTHFWLYDTNFDFSQGEYDNVSAIYYEDNESSYLAGYLAAKASDTGIIAFVGGQDTPSIRNMFVGFAEGAKYANPNIKIISETVGSWNEPAKAREIADRMFEQEASIILTAAGGSSMGVVESAVSHDKQVIGADLDQAAAFASRGQTLYAEAVPTSILKKVDQSIIRGIEREFEGKVRYGETVPFGLAEDFVGLADNEYFKLAFEEDLRNETKAIREEIVAEELIVPSYHDMPEEDFEELKESVSP